MSIKTSGLSCINHKGQKNYLCCKYVKKKKQCHTNKKYN